jgi:hypothetical protein
VRLACLAELRERVASLWLGRSWHAVQRLPSVPLLSDDQQVTASRRSRRLRPLFRALPPACPAASFRALHSLARVGTRPRAAALLSLLVLLSAFSRKVPCAAETRHPKDPDQRPSWTEGATLLPGCPLAAFVALSELLRSESRWQGVRPRSSTLLRSFAQPYNLPGVFHPDNTLELSPSGLFPAQRRDHVSVSLPPVLLRRELGLAAQLRRVAPSAQCEVLSSRTEAQPAAAPLALLAFSPLRRSPPQT